MNVDRNQLTGLIIITAMLMGYNYFFAQKPMNAGLESTKTTPESSPATSAVESSSANTTAKPVLRAPSETFVLENENLRIQLSSDSGNIKEVAMKKYFDENGLPLVLLDEEDSKMGYVLTLGDGTVVHTQDLQFKKQSYIAEKNEVTLVADLGNDTTMVSRFSLDRDGYSLKHDWFLEKSEKEIVCKKISLEWKSAMKSLEKDITACRNKTTINYFSAKDNFDHLKETSSKKEEHTFQESMRWISFKQRFFSTALVSNDAPFLGGTIATTPASDTEIDKVLKHASASLALDSSKAHHGLTFYFGPNDYSTLKKVTKGFYRNIPLGWSLVRWINLGVIIPIFKVLANHISNYALIILLLVLLVKLLLLPLSYRAYLSTAKMKLLKPALDEIKERLGHDMHKVQMEHMKLYKEFGVNPLGGLGLIILQMPILFAMFYLIPNMIQFRGKALLWAADASTFDSILNLPFNIPLYGSHVSLFTLLMTISTILHTMANSDMKSQQGPIKMLAYTMPITFMLILNSFPSALSFYYFISNLATLGIQFVIKNFVNEDQIKKQLEENRQKIRSKPQSTFRARIDAMMSEAKKNKK